MKFNKEIAEKMKTEFLSRQGKAKRMFDYYSGNSDVKYNYPVNEARSNRKVTDNFIKAFIDEEVSFMVGQPITYVDRGNNGNVIEEIEKNIALSSATIDIETATNLLIFGQAYELYYKNNDEFKIKSFNPINSYAYTDTEGNVLLFMYFYKKELDDNTYIQFIDDSFIYDMDENFNILKDELGNEKVIPHYFNCCPVGYAKLPNGELDTLYNNLKDLQDAYEFTMSDWGNEIGDTRLAYLVLTGVELDEDEATDMKTKGILQIPDPSGRADFLIKNIPSDFVKEYREVIKEDIYRVAQHIDNQTQIQSNTSGQMLSVRMNCLRLKIMSQNAALKNCIKTRVKCLLRYLDVNKNISYDYRLISINPQLNLPQNDTETAQIITQLSGKMSIRTLLERLSFVTNGDKEFERALEEQKMIDENLSTLDLNKVADVNE